MREREARRSSPASGGAEDRGAAAGDGRGVAGGGARRLRAADGLLAGLIFALALAARLLFLHTTPDRAWPHSAYYQGDATFWAEWAAALTGGQPYEHDLPFRSPAVAFVLHWLGFGEAPAPPLLALDFTPAKVLWCALSALGCALAYLALAATFTRRAALIAAGCCAFSFASYAQATSLNGEALYTTLLMVIVLGTLRLAERPGWALAAGVGVLHGLASLIRAEHPLLAGLLGLSLLWRWWGRGALPPAGGGVGGARWGRWGWGGRGVGMLAAMTAAFFLVCLPWAVRGTRATARYNTVQTAALDMDHAYPPWRTDAKAFINGLPAFARVENFNYLVYRSQVEGLAEVTAADARRMLLEQFGAIPEPLRTPTFLSSQGGMSFALANHPLAGGGFSKAGLAVPGMPDPPINYAIPTHTALHNHGVRIGLGSIAEDPARWARLVGAKLAIFAEGATQGLSAWNWPLGRDGVRRAVDQFTASGPAATPWRIALGLLFAAGLVIAAAQRKGGIWVLILVGKVVVTVLYYGYARQAASVLPAFAIFAALPIDAALGALERRWKPALGLQIAAGLLLAGGLVAADLGARRAGTTLHLTGSVAPDERWGEEAFVSFQDLLMRVEPGRPEEAGTP